MSTWIGDNSILARETSSRREAGRTACWSTAARRGLTEALRYSWLAVIAVLVCVIFAGQGFCQEDVSGVASEERFAGGDQNKRYFLMGGRENAAPEDGFGLVVVLPGGDGGADFNAFVKRVYNKSLSEDYLAAELVAVKGTGEQQVVWPTKKVAADKQGFSTEEFIDAVIRDVGAKYGLDYNYVFLLAWSSGGPAAYAYSLQKERLATGSFIAMSVFKAENLPGLEGAKGHAYFIFHSPEDQTCPVSMAEAAAEALEKNGAAVKLQQYGGGHGWPAYPYGRIASGIQWLEENHGEVSAVSGEPNQSGAQPGGGEKESSAGEGTALELPPLVEAPAETNPRFWITDEDGKIGYIDETGMRVIKPQFEGFLPEGFSEGLARVAQGDRGAYIDKTGTVQLFLEEKFVSASNFSEGLAAVGLVVGEELLYGYIDMTGEIVIEPNFTQASDFCEGLARVQVGGKARGFIGGKYGYIDKSGAFVAEAKFDWAEDFSEGLGCVSTGGRRGGLFADFGGKVGSKFGYIDKEGRLVIEAKFRRARPFSNGLAAAAKGRKVGFIDRRGNFVIEPQFDSAQDFSEGLANVVVAGKVGYIDRTGKYVIEPKFKGMTHSFSEGLAAVYDEKEKFGFIDRTGEFVIEPRFSLVQGFHNGLARVSIMTRSGIKNGYINKADKFVWGPK